MTALTKSMENMENDAVIGRTGAGFTINGVYIPPMEVKEAPEELEAYYNPTTDKFWLKTGAENYCLFGQESMIKELEQLGYSTKSPRGSKVSQADRVLSILRRTPDMHVSRVGEFAGFPKGKHPVSDGLVLATRGPALLTPVKGDWQTIETVLTSMFKEQLPVIYSWIKMSIRPYYEGILPTINTCPVPALVLVGPRKTGKTLFLNHILGPICGGRIGAPHQFSTGGTNFNGDLAKSELLIMDDEGTGLTDDARKRMESVIKTYTVATRKRVAAKFKDADFLPLTQRLVVAINPGNIRILPDRGPDIDDKLALVQTHGPFPFQIREEEELEFNARIKSELPAFLHYIREEFVMPDDLVSNDGRCSKLAVKHPDIVAELEEEAWEKVLEGLLVETYFSGRDGFEWGNGWKAPGDIRKDLESTALGAGSHKLKHVPDTDARLGRQLAKLASHDTCPLKIEKRRQGYGMEYKISKKE